MNILVTGGAGFIGSNIVEVLVEKGHNVSVIDNFATGKKENLSPKASFYKIDIRDKGVISIFEEEKPDIVIHNAAQVSVRISVDDPGQDADINICGSLNILEASRDAGVKKIIFASSGGTVYGEQEYFPADEKHPLRPISPYGVAKLAIEKYLHYYYHSFGLDYISLRYGNVYGPRQDPYGEAGVVAIFSKKILQGGNPVINGDGKQTRDYVYVGDVVASNILAMKSDYVGPVNIGTGIETDVNRLFNILKGFSNRDIEELHGPAKKGEQGRSVLSYGQARKVLGWEPKVGIKEGLKKTYKWFEEKD